MTNPIFRATAALALLAVSSWVAAGEPADKATTEKLRAALTMPAMGLEVSTVEKSVIPGLYEVQFSTGPVVYSTATGDHIILGDLFAVDEKGYTNLTEKRRDGDRLAKLAKVDEKDMIIFPARGEPRAQLTVFTDVSCFYCQKLHKEVPELNKRGVEVRYLAYPRSGVDSPGYRQLATAWCATDRQDTLTRLKNQLPVTENVCADNPVAAQYELGQELGVRGTPALIMEDGTLIPGYQSADDLMVTLGLD
ncbi:MAG: DsbC family protein [Halioglobus sp.]|nr:DsbC family protein [Halioglobus sp.]